MASDMPLEDVSKVEELPEDEQGDEYNPAEVEKSKKLPQDNRKSRASRSKSPTGDGPGNKSKKDIQCKIFLLNGDVMELTVDRKVKAADLLERVHTEVDIYEKDYFALYFIENNQKIFLENHKLVKDQVPSGMRGEWRLRYGVKFYLSDPSILKEDITRYLFCLQLSQDIKANRVLVDRETATILTALMLQANLGDYDANVHKAGYTAGFNDFILLPKEDLPSNYESQLIEVHQAKAGYTPSQAEEEFLLIAKKLLRYGMHLFAAKEKSGSVVLIGLSYRGISLFKDHVEVVKYPWPNINKIAYKRYKFIIRHRLSSVASRENLAESSLDDPMGARGSGDIQIVKLYTGAAPNAKRIWKCAVEQHTFFRLQIPEKPSRMQQVFRRGTKFRYSGRTLKQLQKSTDSREEPKLTRTYSERLRENPRKNFAPGYVPARNSFRAKKQLATSQFVVGKQDPEKGDWVLLDAPPTSEKMGGSLEEQMVQVKFRLKDGLPETQQKFIIVKKDNKYQIERVGAPAAVGGDQPPTDDISYNLKKMNPNSKSNVTHVSIKLQPKPINVAPRSASITKGAIPIYDSTKIPDVDLRQHGSVGDVDDVTTFRTVSSGPVAKGAVLRRYPEEQIYPLRFNAPTDEEDQAAQLKAFLEREKEIISQVLLKKEDEQ